MAGAIGCPRDGAEWAARDAMPAGFRAAIYDVAVFDRFTDRAREVMGLARQEAQRFNHDYIGTEHILVGLVQEGRGVGANVLRNLDVDLEKVRQDVEKLMSAGTRPVTLGQLPFTPRAKKVLELSLEEATHLGHTYIGTEHLLLGLMREAEGVAARVLSDLKLRVEDVREEVLDLLNEDPPESDASGAGSRATASVDPKRRAAGPWSQTGDAILLEPQALAALRLAWTHAHDQAAHVGEVGLLYGVLTERNRRSSPLAVPLVALGRLSDSARAQGALDQAYEPEPGDRRPHARHFSPPTLVIVGAAFQRAARRGATRVSSDDLLAALLADDAGIACRALRDAGLDPAAIRPPD